MVLSKDDLELTLKETLSQINQTEIALLLQKACASELGKRIDRFGK